MKDVLFTVDKIEFLTDSVFELRLNANEDLPFCRSGQFLQLKVPALSAPLLRRPFCLYRFSTRQIGLIIAVVGKGTAMLKTLKKGDTVWGVLPLGNGFIPTEKMKQIAVIGGGVGCAPLLHLAKDTPKTAFKAFLGFASNLPTLDKFVSDFEKMNFIAVKASTDDGSYGFFGNAVQCFLNDYEKGYRPDAIFTCGSYGMLKAAAKLSKQLKIPAYMSGETRMGCGVGACLVCACDLKKADGTVERKRACADGPVFSLDEILL